MMISNWQVFKVIVIAFIMGVITMAFVNGNIKPEQFTFKNNLADQVSNSFREYRKGTSLEGR